MLDIGDVVVVHDVTVSQRRNIPVEENGIGIVTNGEDLDRSWDQNGEPSVTIFFGYKSSTTAYGYELNQTIRTEDLTYLGRL